MSYNKVVGWTLYEKLKGGVRKEQLIAFYKRYIDKKYKKHLILMDNASPHRSLLLRKLIKKSGNYLLYTVPYHPETNPIEEYYSQLKHYIRKKELSNYNAIKREIRKIIGTKIKKKHLENYFKHSFKIYK